MWSNDANSRNLARNCVMNESSLSYIYIYKSASTASFLFINIRIPENSAT